MTFRSTSPFACTASRYIPAAIAVFRHPQGAPNLPKSILSSGLLRNLVISLSCLAVPTPFAIGATPPGDLSLSIVAFPSSEEEALRGAGVEIWTRSGDAIVGGATDGALAKLAREGLLPIVQVPDSGQSMFLLHHEEGMVAPSNEGATIHALNREIDLYLYPAGMRVDHPYVKLRATFMGIPRIPIGPVVPHAADLAPAALTPSVVNPLVTEIVNGTSQANWFQYVKDLSGENPVLVGGVFRTISTRYSNAMFPTPAVNAYATEYLLEKGEAWGYSGVRETYTNANSGCGGAQPIPWQNVVFTIPGQVDMGQHQQVIFVTHYDSLSYSASENFAYAPGADDAMSGGSALIEAMRLFKDYGFRNTVKFIFFSGEEEGLCGSKAYVTQHPTADMWRVVNMDQTAYDGNLNSLMDCYNWSLASSPSSVALGDAFVQANLDYGSIIVPANIVRDTTHMCQTDHCPFWDAGVAAIAITEDLHNNDIHTCFDQSQSATCHDTVTQIDPNHSPRLMFNQAYSWPSEKAAIALVASLADPLYPCPAAAPAVFAAPLDHGANLTWDVAAGVTNYVVERAASCAGPFAPLASVGATNFDDTGLTNGTTYAYRLRTCPNQVSSCVTVVPIGASAGYQAGSAAVTTDTGDHDLIPDNCELVTVSLDVLNDGSLDLTGVTVDSITSTDPAMELVTAMPLALSNLSVGQSAPVTFSFNLGTNGNPAACGSTVPFTVNVVSDQSPAIARVFELQVEKDSQSGTITYDFEADFSGWALSSGSFTRAAGGAPGSAGFSLHSSLAKNACDAIASPVFTPSASSTMDMWVNYGIEGNAGAGSRWDRAIVRVVNTTNDSKTLIIPTGVAYNTTGSDPALCDGIGSLQGWSGDQLVWSQASFNLASFAGIPIRIEVRFSTDNSTNFGTQGFWFDQVQITNASGDGCDAQSNVCLAPPAEVSPLGSPTPLTIGKGSPNDTMTFSESGSATVYHVYAGTLASLQAGVYDHTAVAGFCGIVDVVPGDGGVTAIAPLPENAYFLAVAANGVGESTYGSSSVGTIPPGVTTCP